MKADYTIRVKIAWWLKPYLYALAAFAAITRQEPDWDKVARIIDLALTPKVVPTKD